MKLDRKRRILFIGEASFLATGFSTYWHEVLKRLHATEEFEIAELGCIPNPYSLIQMGDGSLRPISLVKIGDKVISHTGQSRVVTQVFKREAKEEIVEIHREFFGGTTLKLTGNHQVLVIPCEKAYLYDNPKRGSWNKNLIAQWIKADDIRPKDLVAYSTIKDLQHNKTTIERHGLSIPLNDDFAFLVGWFLAEGYIGHHGKLGENHFGVCASLKEEQHIKRFRDCLYRLFNIETDYHKYENKGVYEIKVYNRTVTQFMQSILGSSCYSKFIDPELFGGSQDFLLRLISAYAEGDGHSCIQNNNIVIKTASKQLGLDVVRILLNMDIRCSFKKQSCNIGYRLTISGQYARRLAEYFVYKNKNFNDLQREETLKIDNLIFMKVTQTNRYDHNGPVYNLEVEKDNSYVCDNYVIHNSYAHDDDQRCSQVPWKFYPVAPAKSNKSAIQKYTSIQTSQFGEFRFDEVCLDFKPDIVCGIRDWWMDEFVLRSPFRNNFTFVWMPTIDGEPQRELWLDSYAQSDRILTYSHYGMKLLEKTCRRGTDLVTVASPGADLDVFKPPSNKKEHKAKLGIDPNSLIIGTVMRNQKRKLYYDLIETFSKWLHHSKTKGHTELSKRTFLYLHTSYPDVGYDIGKAIRDFKVGNKVIMTYLCSNCQTAYPAFFAGEMMICRRCGKLAAHPPNANHSCPRNVLADIMKAFDLYVQYSISEGFGMPCVDAIACGIPVAAVDYSAMQDHLRCPFSIPISVERYFWEAIIETEQKRALPNNTDFVKKLDIFLKQTESVREDHSTQIRKYAEEPVEVYGQDIKMPRYGWERTASIWGQVIRETNIKNQETTWLCPTSRINHPNLTAPSDNMNNNEFVEWVIGKVWKRPDMLRTHFSGEWLKSLNSGSRTVGDRRIPFDRKAFMEHFMGIVRQGNVVEAKRIASLTKDIPNKVNVTVM